MHCQEELALLKKMANDFAPQPRALNVIKALFISATQRVHALRGELLQFETDHLRITLDRTRTLGKALRWNLAGEVRTREGLAVTGVREVIVTQIGQHREVGATVLAEVIETDGLFIAEGLSSGDYTLQIHLVDSTTSIIEVIELQGTLHLGDAFTRS